ncbi:PIN domain-containing protein [Terracidiphilus sp.]|uniref:PIN domain-containing protein n=1 Tax=Terracidiphilus sp. TaxID=1964191 RepID=UPI003C24BBCA
MIAADTSTWICFFEGEPGEDVLALAKALQARQVVMPPPVLTELLSDPELPAAVAQTLLELPLIPLKDDFWHRAGRLRAKALGRKRKARLGDALIAQCCIDADIALITRDGDFKAFSKSLELL